MTDLETDEYGNTYYSGGNRFINVTDFQGNGFKFIYVINGVKTLFQDFNQFIETAFKLEFLNAEFVSKTALSIALNQNFIFGDSGPDKTKFQIKDQQGNTIPVDYITSHNTIDNVYYIVLDDDIAENNSYTVIYNYEQFGE